MKFAKIFFYSLLIFLALLVLPKAASAYWNYNGYIYVCPNGSCSSQKPVSGIRVMVTKDGCGNTSKGLVNAISDSNGYYFIDGYSQYSCGGSANFLYVPHDQVPSGYRGGGYWQTVGYNNCTLQSASAPMCCSKNDTNMNNQDEWIRLDVRYVEPSLPTGSFSAVCTPSSTTCNTWNDYNLCYNMKVNNISSGTFGSSTFFLSFTMDSRTKLIRDFLGKSTWEAAYPTTGQWFGYYLYRCASASGCNPVNGAINFTWSKAQLIGGNARTIDDLAHFLEQMLPTYSVPVGANLVVNGVQNNWIGGSNLNVLPNACVTGETVTPTPTPGPNLACFSKSAWDLSTNVIPNGGNVAPGQSFRYQIVAENRSTSSISGVYIIDQLPQYIEFVSDGDGGCRVIATTTAGQQVRCEIGSMVGGNSRKTIYFNVRAKTNLPTNTDQVDSAQVYPLTTGSNTCKHTVKYQPTITITPTPPPPALSCTSKTAYSAGPPFPTGALIPNGANVSRGQQLKYRISYKNNSTTSVSNAYTDDQLPRYIEIPSGTTLPTGCSILPTPTTSTVGQKVRCTIGTVSGGQSGFKEFVARVRTDAPGGSTQLDSAVVQPVKTISNTCTHSVKVLVTLTITPTRTRTPTPPTGTPTKTRTPTPTGVQTACKSYSVHETSGTGSRFLEYKLDPPSILRQLSTFCSHCNVEAMDDRPGTGQVYVVANGESSSQDGRLCVLDKSSGALTNCKNIKRTIEGLAFRSNGELWAWKVGEGLYTVDLSTGALTSKASIKNVDVSAIAWNKDGTRLYLSKDGTNLLYEYNPSTGSFVIFNGGSGQGTLGDTDGMDTSPDGWVVGAHKSGGVKLYAYNLGTKRVQQVYSISTSASNWDGMTEMCPLNLSATVEAAALSYPTTTPVPAISYQPVQVSIYNNNSYYQIAVSARRSGTTSFTECFRKAATATQQYGTCNNLSAGQPHDFRIVGLDCSSGTCREITASAQVKTSIVPSLSEVVFHIDLRSFVSGPTPTRTPTPRFSPTRTPTPRFTTTPVAGTNRLVNPGFEYDSNPADGLPDSWINPTTGKSDSRFTRYSSVRRSGSYSGRHRATDNSSYLIHQAVSGITAGKGYEFRGYVNIASTSDSFTFKPQIRWVNSSGSTISTSTIKTYSVATSGWNYFSTRLTAPTGATSAQIRMSVGSLNATIYIDDFSFFTY